MKTRIKFSCIVLLNFLFAANFHAQNFLWAKKIGNSGADVGRSITVDASGNVYTTGHFEGTVDFDPSAGIYNISSTGDKDIFISKLDATGNFVWAKSLGGTGHDRGVDICVDVSGNVYTTGFFTATADFDPSAGIYNISSTGGKDIFISKLDATGNFVWAKAMGGVLHDDGYGVAVDAIGNVYTAGVFEDTVDFNPGVGVLNLISNGHQDIFITKLDAFGNFIWAKKFGGLSNDFVYSIALDIYGNVYTTGTFSLFTVDFDPGAGVQNLTTAGAGDIFISKLDSLGNFVWAKRIGGINQDQARSIVADVSSNIYVCGEFQGTVDFDPGAAVYDLIAKGNFDVFILKLDASGNFVWAKAIGGSGNDFGNCIAIDAIGNVYTTGYFIGSADFDPSGVTHYLTSVGSNNIYINKLDYQGNFVWAKQMGGTDEDQGLSISLDTSFNVHTTGSFLGAADFDPGVGSQYLYASGGSQGGTEIFISKLSQTVSTNIDNYSLSNFISVYPNPNLGVFKIKNVTENSSIAIYDLFGSIIYYSRNLSNEIEINIEGTSKGIYFYKIISEKNKSNFGKIVIE